MTYPPDDLGAPWSLLGCCIALAAVVLLVVLA